MLESVKGALRVTSNDPSIVLEIQDLIDGAKMDLIQSGISKTVAEKEDDPLIKRAVVLYAKSQYGIDNPQAERFWESYESLKKHLSFAGDYNGKLE